MKNKIFLLSATLILASCYYTRERDNPLDPGGVNYKSESSSSVPQVGGVSSSSLNPAPVSSSDVVISSSEVISSVTPSSSSVIVQPSSSSVVSGGINTQTCTYNSTTNTLACSEKIYKTVTIGSQVWMAENLNYGTMVTGKINGTLQTATQKFCYDDLESNCTSDGGLYQWHTAMGISSSYASSDYTILSGNVQGICPMGWHLPRAADWDALQTILGGSTIAGKKMKATITNDTYGWNNSSYNDATNTSGFGAVPAGSRNTYGGFDYRGKYASFWEAEQSSSTYAWYRGLGNGYSGLLRYGNYKALGFSIRCVKD